MIASPVLRGSLDKWTPARLHQQTLDIRKYQADQNAGIETPEDLKILHDMCSFAAAEQPTTIVTITPSDCNNPPPFSFLQPSQYPTQPQPQFQQYSSGLVQLANKSAVIACLNHVLVDSISKAAITGSLSFRNNTKGTITGGSNQTFITNATNTLDACILPRR
jgi:hypothetical protein